MKHSIKISLPEILIFLVVTFSLLLQFIPLASSFNFEYSFILSIVLFISSGILTIYYLRKFKTFGMLPAIMRMKYREYSLLIITPFVISVTINLLFKICPVTQGIIYYFSIVLPTFYFGFVTGAFAFWSNKKYAYFIFLGIFTLFTIAPLIEFYFYPQVYFYNVIVGIIPGTIYDEEILLGNKLFVYRIALIILFTFLLYSIFKIKVLNHKTRKIILLLSTGISIVFYLLKPQFGWATSENNLKANLRGEYITDEITIRYADNLTPKQVYLLGLKHKYYSEEISRKTKLPIPSGIVSYIFKNSEQKGILFGSKAANIAKPWMNKIFINFGSVDETLEHELTHIFAAYIGSTPFKIADDFNMAMLEGYAMAIENNYAGYDIHYMALLAKASGYNFNISQLFSQLNFFGQTSSLSYIIAGSFVKFLIETYGIEKVNLLYQDLDFQKYFGKNIAALNKEYNNFLTALNYPINKHRANLFFGRKPITKKICPRTVASDLHAAWELFRNEEYHAAHNKFLQLWNYSNSFSALTGVIYSDNKLELYQELLQLLQLNIDKYEGTSSYYPALLYLGDAFSVTGNFKKADSLYTLLSEFEPTERYKNIAEIRRKLIQEKKILPYLKGSSYDKYQILKLLNKNELLDFSIPIMIELSEKLNENSSSFGKILDNKNPENISYNTAFELSKYFVKNLQFQKALFFAKLSLKKCKTNFMMPVLLSNQQKIKWFYENK